MAGKHSESKAGSPATRGFLMMDDWPDALLNGDSLQAGVGEFLRGRLGVSSLPPALEALFLDPSPPATVRSLARRCHVSLRTLHRRWNCACPLEGRPPLREVVDLSLAVCAFDRRRKGRCMKEVARSLGVSQRTLQRLPDRVFGCPCSRFFGLKPADVLPLLSVRLEHLCGPTASPCRSDPSGGSVAGTDPR